jgi:hypothetical protein
MGGLPDHYKAMIEVAGNAQVAVTYAETEAMQFDAMRRCVTSTIVQVKRWERQDLGCIREGMGRGD